jgi:hypothetical protein
MPPVVGIICSRGWRTSNSPAAPLLLSPAGKLGFAAKIDQTT